MNNKTINKYFDFALHAIDRTIKRLATKEKQTKQSNA